MYSGKSMNLWSVVSIGIGSMLGAGIFALLGQMVLTAGDKIYIAFAFAGFIAMLSGYSYSKLAELYPTSGGITDYFTHAFSNKFWASLFSGIYLATLCVSVAMLGKSFGIYLTTLLGLSHQYLAYSSMGIIVLIGLFNIKGAGIGKAEVFLVGLKLSILVALIGLSFYQYFWVIKPPFIDHSNFSTGFWKSVSFAFFAYAGYGVMTNAAGDVKNPRRTIPLAIFIAIITIVTLYMSLAFVVMKYAPMADLEKNIDTAIVVASKAVLGKEGFAIISIAALLALLSGMNALFYSSYKIMGFMCEKHELPSFLNKKIISSGTIGMFIVIIATGLSSFCFNFADIATVASSAFLVSYIAVFIAHLILFKKTNSSLLLILLGLVSMVVVFVQSLI